MAAPAAPTTTLADYFDTGDVEDAFEGTERPEPAHVESTTDPSPESADGDLADQLDPTQAHRKKLSTLNSQPKRVYWACSVLGADIATEDLQDTLTPKMVANWLVVLTGDKRHKNTKVCEPMNNPWKRWAIAVRSGDPAPPDIKEGIRTMLEQMSTECEGTVPIRPQWLDELALYADKGPVLVPADMEQDSSAPVPGSGPTPQDQSEAADNDSEVDAFEPELDGGEVSSTVSRDEAREIFLRKLNPPELADQDAKRTALAILSAKEWEAERELAEWIRAELRAQRRRVVEAEIAAKDLARTTEVALAKINHRDRRDASKALSALRRKVSPGAQLAWLHRYQIALNWGAVFVVVAGMGWSASNVQHNIAGSAGMADPLYWFSYLIEAMISVMLVLVMVGKPKLVEWDADPKHIIWGEVGLLAMTIGLNTYPHLNDGRWDDAAVHAVAPVMIGIAMLIHHKMSAGVEKSISRAAQRARDLDTDGDEPPASRVDWVAGEVALKIDQYTDQSPLPASIP
ncbi:hypothetical protein [Nocardia suismassiliense]|uniref:hypothetical protein n=1 Tax=Nocardia suismassiliense TaxID=2077092 RepID=UPI000D1DC381|nr:hypothetical protein [Nocardia suismassiliense]